MALSKKKEQEYIEKVRADGLFLKRIKVNQTALQKSHKFSQT